jgi:hypothetical protein
MISAADGIGSTDPLGVGVAVSPLRSLQEERVVEDADRSAASGEDAATVDGVHFKAVTGIGRVSDKRAAGRPGELKGEGIGVCRCPFSDDVGDEASAC